MGNIIPTLFFEYSSWLMFIPVMLAILLVLFWKNPSFLSAWHRQTKEHRQNNYYLPNADILKQHTDEKITKSRTAHFLSQTIKYGLFLSLIFIAFAQPYHLGQKLPTPPQYHDIVFLVDTSITMSLKDYQIEGKRIERMTMLKNVLSHFIDNLKGSRIGITVYSEHAYTLVPLTTDYALLKTQLQRLESAVLTGRISNPSNALLYTAKQYQHSTKKPALAMLTDIDRPDRKIDPRAAASYLSQNGFHLHTIGIGAASQAAQDDEISTLIYQPANFQLLEDIAKAGKGHFFWAKNITSLNNALTNIKNAELRTIEKEPEFIKQPLYIWFLMPALLWVSFWQLLPLLRAQP